MVVILLFADEPAPIAFVAEGEINIGADDAFPIPCPLVLGELVVL